MSDIDATHETKTRQEFMDIMSILDSGEKRPTVTSTGHNSDSMADDKSAPQNDNLAESKHGGKLYIFILRMTDYMF